MTAKDPPTPVVKAAFALVNTGDVSGVVDAGNGQFYILKQTGRRKSMTKSFDEAKPQIRNKLFREQRMQAQKDFVEGLRRAGKDRGQRGQSFEGADRHVLGRRVEYSRALTAASARPRRHTSTPSDRRFWRATNSVILESHDRG